MKRVFRAASLLQVAHARNVLMAAGHRQRAAQPVSGRRSRRFADAGNLAATVGRGRARIGRTARVGEQRPPRRRALPGSARSAVSSSNRSSPPVGAAARPISECIACASREIRALECAHGDSKSPIQALIFNRLRAVVGQTPTALRAKSEPRISPEPWPRMAAQVTNCDVLTCNDYTRAFSRRFVMNSVSYGLSERPAALPSRPPWTLCWATSAAMQEVFRLIERVGPTEASVLLDRRKRFRQGTRGANDP